MNKKEEKESKGKGSGVVVSIVIIAAIVLIILGFSLLSNKNAGQKNETSDNDGGSLQDETSQDTGASEISEPTEYIVEIKLEGFVPKTLKIKKDDKVTWVNKIVTKSWVAGNFHPTHTVYPGSSIIKCGTAEEKDTFDSCKELQNGESYSFVFNEVGEWGYHNHLNPSKDARIIVEE